MPITQPDTTFYKSTGKRLSSISSLKLYPIFLDNDRETKFLNLFRSYRLNEDVITNVVFYDTYEVSNNEYWDDVAFNLYGIPQLWWVVALINNVVNPFEELEDGDTLKVLRENYIYTLMNDLESLSEL